MGSLKGVTALLLLCLYMPWADARRLEHMPANHASSISASTSSSGSASSASAGLSLSIENGKTLAGLSTKAKVSRGIRVGICALTSPCSLVHTPTILQYNSRPSREMMSTPRRQTRSRFHPRMARAPSAWIRIPIAGC